MRRPVSRKHRTKGEYPYYGATGIQDYVAEWIFDETLVLLGEDGAKWAAGDNSAFLITGKTWVNNHAHVLRPNASLLHEWLILVLNGLDLLPFVTCTTVPKLNQEKTRTIPIPLPPISEQRNIVSRFEGLSSFCDSIDEDSIALDTLARTAKSRILDLAIRGALVFQNPTDEPASKLLNRIGSTTDKPPCTKLSHETLFQIPESWVWTTLDNVICPTETTAPSGTTFTYIDIDAIDNKENTIKDPKTLLTAKAPSRARRRVSGGDTIFSMVRPYLRNIAKVPRNLSGATASTGFFVCRPSEALDENYLFDLMRSNYVVDGLNQFMKGDNSPSISGNHILKFPIPLPPLAEQRRIAEKVNELFASIDSMITK